MYVYIYNNNTKYGKFDDLLVKNGYNIVEELISGVNVTINHSLNRFRFTGSLLDKITSNSNWAIGDEFENLYLACNHNYSGFNFYKKHFRNDLVEIGAISEEPPIEPIIPMFIISDKQLYYIIGTSIVSETYSFEINDNQGYQVVIGKVVQPVYDFEIIDKQPFEISGTSDLNTIYEFNINDLQTYEIISNSTALTFYSFNIEDLQRFEITKNSGIIVEYAFEINDLQNFAII